MINQPEARLSTMLTYNSIDFVMHINVSHLCLIMTQACKIENQRNFFFTKFMVVLNEFGVPIPFCAIMASFGDMA